MSAQILVLSRRILLAPLATLAILSAPLIPLPALAEMPSATEVLPSWNDGPAKQAIVDFVKATTDPTSPKFVQPEDRVATRTARCGSSIPSTHS
jgi:hypothetical protein